MLRVVTTNGTTHPVGRTPVRKFTDSTPKVSFRPDTPIAQRRRAQRAPPPANRHPAPAEGTDNGRAQTGAPDTQATDATGKGTTGTTTNGNADTGTNGNANTGRLAAALASTRQYFAGHSLISGLIVTRVTGAVSV